MAVNRMASLGVFALSLFLCLGCISAAFAQTAPEFRSQDSTQPIRLEADAEQAPEKAAGPTSFNERVLESLRNRIGFSLGISQNYTQDSQVFGGRVLYTTANPRLYANLSKNRTQLTFDYGLSYRSYNREGRLTDAEHTATMRFERRLSRNVSFELTDAVSSAFNDYGFTGLTVGAAHSVSDVYVYLQRQRVTNNLLTPVLKIRQGRRANVAIAGAYTYWHYGRSMLGNTRSVQLGVRGDYRVNKWLFFETQYSGYLTVTNQRSRSTDIQKVQIGGFRFKRRSIDLFSSGAIEFANNQTGRREVGSGADIGFSSNSVASQFSLVYHRGFTTTGAIGTVMGGQSVSALLSRWLSNRVNFQAKAVYYRGLSATGPALQSLTTNASIEIALQRHLMMYATYWRYSQHASKLPITALTGDRYGASIGLQYSLQSLVGH